MTWACATAGNTSVATNAHAAKPTSISWPPLFCRNTNTSLAEKMLEFLMVSLFTSDCQKHH
jgi:hypothetical protein